MQLPHMQQAILSCLGIFFILLGSGFSTTRAAASCTDPAACRGAMTFEGRRLVLFLSAPLDRPQPGIRRAIVVVHGTDGNADSYFRAVTKAAALAGQAETTLIVAPRFLEDGDRDKPEPGEFFWSRGSDWRAGDPSNHDTLPPVSSFDLMSRVIAKIADPANFPNLRDLFLTGHSAGGQFIQRYAIGQPDDPAFAALRVTYVVANPSAYLYLDARRPVAEQAGVFAIPPRAGCQTNRFKYGFEQLNDYFKRQAVDDMIARYRTRDVVYLLGESDNDPNAHNLSRTCAARAQGPPRLARGQSFMAHMDAFHAPHAHRLVTVPGVGHSAARMFQSRPGQAVLFGK